VAVCGMLSILIILLARTDIPFIVSFERLLTNAYFVLWCIAVQVTTTSLSITMKLSKIIVGFLSAAVVVPLASGHTTFIQFNGATE
jgi:hypothetical protein